MNRRWVSVLAGCAAVISLAACKYPELPQLGGPSDATGQVDGSTIDASLTDAGMIEQSCAGYCGAIATNCTGSNAMYGSQALCMATCALWPAGTMGETTGITRACHIYHAGAAASSPAIHCRHAGPGGDGQCGDNCQGFCTIVLGACGSSPYPTATDCITACNGFIQNPQYNALQTTGNTFACRLYHATAAAAQPAAHCPHTAPNSAICQ